MTTSSLREFNRDIESLIDRGQNNEAIFHCMNILHSYPKCIDTYRNLGKALLESKRYSEASDIFSKILTVFPDDFVSHVGLSIIQEDQRDLDSSIWHMEQAFDSQPSNLALQEELRRLLGRRDGVPPIKVRLSRGALVRMYARGELYQQAIAEIQSSLKDEENRLDLQALLAKMYHLSGSNVEAADVSSRILLNYPYCFDANKILFDLLPTVEENANSIFKRRLSELDPYFSFVTDAHQTSSEIPVENVTLEKLDYSPSSSIDGTIPDWAKLIGIDWKNGEAQRSTASTDSRSLADILSEDVGATSASAPVNPFLDADISNSGTSNAVSKTSPSEEPLPDWISNAGWTRADEFNEPQSFQGNTADDSELVKDAAPADDIPDWLKSLNLEDNSDLPMPQDFSKQNNMEEQSIPPEIPVFSDQISSSDDLKESISNWSNQIEDVSSNPLAGVPQNDDWTNKLTSEVPEDDSTEPDELPEWLRNFEKDNETSNTDIDNIADWVPSSIQDENTNISSDQMEVENKAIEPQGSIVPTEETMIAPEISPDLEIPPTSSVDIPLPTLSTDVPPPLPEISQVAPEALKEDITIAPVSRTSKLPGWIRNILSISSPVAPVVESVLPETTEKVAEDIVEPLVSDLPADHEHEGAISSETKDELLSWLREVNPESDELMSSELQPEVHLEEIPTEQSDSPDLSLESLTSDESKSEFAAESLSDNLNVLPDSDKEVNVFDDRLSGLLEEPVEKADSNEFDDRFSELLSEPDDEKAMVSELDGLPEDIVDENDFTDYGNRLSDLLEEPKDETVSTPELEGFVNDETVSTPELEGFVKDETVWTPELEGFVKKETISTSELEGFVKEDLVKPELPELAPEPLSNADMGESTLESSDAFPEFNDLMETNTRDLNQELIPSLEAIEEPSVNQMDNTPETLVNEPSEVEMSEPIIVAGVNLLDLVKNDDYSTLDQEVNRSLAAGTPVESIIDSIKEASGEKQDKFEFWQILGDLLTKSSKYDEAIEHYSKAEKILLK